MTGTCRRPPWGLADVAFSSRAFFVRARSWRVPHNARLGVEFLPTINFSSENGPRFSLGFVVPQRFITQFKIPVFQEGQRAKFA
jgi:hypothetical protein